ncbi:hypothetical protein ABID42_003120 [Arcicella rosea]
MRLIEYVSVHRIVLQRWLLSTRIKIRIYTYFEEK